jgi:hypothetical protein
MSRSRVPANERHSTDGCRARKSSGTFFAASPMISRLRTKAQRLRTWDELHEQIDVAIGARAQPCRTEPKRASRDAERPNLALDRPKSLFHTFTRERCGFMGQHCIEILERLEATIDENAFRIELRAHCAVADEHTTSDGFEKGLSDVPGS